MTRSCLLAAVAILTASVAVARPPTVTYGKSFEVEITQQSMRAGAGLEFVLPTLEFKQGERLRFEVDPVGGAEMTLYVEIETPASYPLGTSGPGSGTVNWTTKGLPGREARARVRSNVAGLVNVRITKVGAAEPGPAADPGTPATPPPGLDARVRRLEEQNAEISRQLAEIRRLLEQKK